MALEPALAFFTKLVGGCFAATLGSGAEDRHCFTTLYDGAHVQDQHVVSADGKPAYQGVSTYSATPGGLFLTYVNSTGGSGDGTATTDATSFTYNMTMRGDSKGAANPYAGKWSLTPDGYDVIVLGQPVRHYKRVP